jgi:hypothetical protein
MVHFSTTNEKPMFVFAGSFLTFNPFIQFPDHIARVDFQSESLPVPVLDPNL